MTLNVLMTLNNYQVVVWRSNIYAYNHITYFYVGQLNDPTTQLSYASDFASGWLDASRGFVGASVNFFTNHFGQNSLSNVKVMMLIFSDSDSIASIFLSAGAQAIIEFTGAFSQQFATADDLANGIFQYLAQGNDVADSVSNTIQPFQNMVLEDPLDSMNLPSVAYSGNSAITIV